MTTVGEGAQMPFRDGLFTAASGGITSVPQPLRKSHMAELPPIPPMPKFMTAFITATICVVIAVVVLIIVFNSAG
jgi:hypothetical protein